MDNPEIDQLLEQIAAESVGVPQRLANLGAQGLASIAWEQVGYLKS